jgi:hypothetical protein
MDKILEPDKLNSDDEKIELMIVNKCPLRNIIKGTQDRVNYVIKKIEGEVIKAHRLNIQIDQYLEMYLLHKYSNNEEFPKINSIFIKAIIRTLTVRDNIDAGAPPSEATKILLAELKKFHEEHYSKCIKKYDIINDTKMNFIMAYESNDIIKNIETNISEHFIDHVKKFVNISFNVHHIIDDIMAMKIDDKMKKYMKQLFYAEIKTVTDDLLRLDDNFTSNSKYHKWLKEHRKNIIRKKSFCKGSVYYDICKNSQDYLKSMFYINKEFEKLNKGHIKDTLFIKKANKAITECLKRNNEDIALFNVIPKRTNIIPKYITFDTAELVQLLCDNNKISYYLNNITKECDNIWKKDFRINSKEFKRKNYKFHHMIKTDGIGCSVLLIKTIKGKAINITPKMSRETGAKIKAQDKYIDNIALKDRDKKKIVIDPNMGDLIYCLLKEVQIGEPIPIGALSTQSQREGMNEVIFRYTQKQRQHEIGTKKYNSIFKLKSETMYGINSVKDIESELSIHNSKTTDFEKKKEYCKKKNEINRILFKYYEEPIFRKIKLNKYINTQKSESKMLVNFKKKYGSPKDYIIVVGDWSGKNVKGKEPVISKRLRTIFRRAGYSVYLIDEYNTSKKCNECCGECEIFMDREIKDKRGNKQIVKCWGLVRCKNGKCNMIHNRDKNSTLNMSKIITSIMSGKGRPPEYLQTNIHTKPCGINKFYEPQTV